MAKKNSTKTATKEALQVSEPRFATFKSWQGINIKESPLGWNPNERDQRNDSNLKPNYLVVQNNVDTTSSLSLETRQDEVTLAEAPAGREFTGVSCLRNDLIFCSCEDGTLWWKDITDSSEWTMIPIESIGYDGTTKFSCIGYYQRQLICLTEAGRIFTGEFGSDTNGDDTAPTKVACAALIHDPTEPVDIYGKGILDVYGTYRDGKWIAGSVSDPKDIPAEAVRLSFTYVYVNQFGTTMAQDNNQDWTTIYVDKGPQEWGSNCYVNIQGPAVDPGILGIDLYMRQDENMSAIYIGHVDFEPSENSTRWSFNWLGAMMDTSNFTQTSLTIPTMNTTEGVNASYFRVHDGRLYFWGGDVPYRLYIGGNPGNELSVARGVGGAWVDIEPGSGTEIRGTAKFKTYNGASIVTIMCSNKNSGKVKRYNLLETNLTVTNELSSKGYMTEEVANVVGATSHYGFGVWADGLYTVNRYGLMITTMAMESNNQLRAQSVSDVIAPIFTDEIAMRLDNCHMIYIDDMIYIALGADPTNNADNRNLDNAIICYDINAKAFFTYTYGSQLQELPIIKSIFNVDYRGFTEGIGIITNDKIVMIPVTGNQDPVPSVFPVLIETGELTLQLPSQQYAYTDQLEFDFDYFIGELTFIVEGIDYYGRHRTIYKHVKEDEMQRSYPVWIKIAEIFRTFKVTIEGYARFRLTHFISKSYQESKKINQVYGYDDWSYYANRHGGVTDIHHYLESYNNLREVILP